MRLTRRRFLLLAATAGIASAFTSYFVTMATRRMKASRKEGKAQVFVLKTDDREEGLRRLLRGIELSDYRGRQVLIKANYNSADPFPATTHPDTLRAVVRRIKEERPKKVVLVERSGMGATRDVLRRMGVLKLAEEEGFDVVVLDEIGREEWISVGPDGTHWLKGFFLPKVLFDSDKIVQTCCLKTHRFGGHFTMSLKNSVGLVAKQIPGELYDYMWELHASPYQRSMIAEVNYFYTTDLIVMDAMKAFVKGGPERGDIVEPHIFLLGKDRVAVDAVGVAILRSYGTTDEVMRDRIFEQEQIHRAAEIGVGVSSAQEIELIPVDENSIGIVKKLDEILRSQG